MLTIEQWLQEYDVSHRNPFNKLTHWICVPAIMFSILGLCWSIAIPDILIRQSVPFNWALVVIVLALGYYALLSVQLAVGMLLVSMTMVGILLLLEQFSAPLWQLSLLIFVLAWIGQFIGHKVEGKKPSFFKDVQFLLIGPLWLLSFVYRKLGINY